MDRAPGAQRPSPTATPGSRRSSGSRPRPTGGESCWHLFVVATPERERLREALNEAGIGARPYYEIPLYRQPAVERWAPPEPLPNTERICAEMLALPMGTALDPDAPAQVVEAVATSLAAV